MDFVDDDVGAVLVVRARRDRTSDVVQHRGGEEQIAIGRLETVQVGQPVEEE